MRPMINSQRILVVTVLIIAGVLFKSHISKSTEIKRNGNKIFITTGKHNIEASVVGPEKTESLLVFGGSGKSELDFTIPFSVIPIQTAEMLAKRYGNFFRCDSPGAPEAKRNIRSLFLYPENRNLERSLKSIDRLTIKDKNPVIKMSYVELMIIDHTFTRFGEEVKMDYRGGFISCLVKDIQIIQENKQF